MDKIRSRIRLAHYLESQGAEFIEKFLSNLADETEKELARITAERDAAQERIEKLERELYTLREVTGL